MRFPILDLRGVDIRASPNLHLRVELERYRATLFGFSGGGRHERERYEHEVHRRDSGAERRDDMIRGTEKMGLANLVSTY